MFFNRIQIPEKPDPTGSSRTLTTRKKNLPHLRVGRGPDTTIMGRAGVPYVSKNSEYISVESW